MLEFTAGAGIASLVAVAIYLGWAKSFIASAEHEGRLLVEAAEDRAAGIVAAAKTRAAELMRKAEQKA